MGTSIVYRLYPNKKQEQWLIDMGNKYRGMYNLLVKNYIDEKKSPGTNLKWKTEMINYLNTIEWTEDVPSIFVDSVVDNFQSGLAKFYKYIKENKGKKKDKKKGKKKNSIGHPTKKKKTYELNLTSNSGNLHKASTLDFENQTFEIFRYILKRKEISPIFKLRIHKKFDNPKIKRMSISKNAAGQWHISFTFDLNIPKPEPIRRGDKKIGIDVGIKDMAITSDGNKFNVPIIEIKKLEDRISRLDKHISRIREVNKGNFKSKNYFRLMIKRGKLFQRMNDLKDQAHNYATKVLTKDEVGQINVEDIKLSFMLQNKHLSKATARNGIRNFTTNLENISKSKGIVFNRINPKNTSRMCSDCGEINSELKLHHREWTCEACGVIHDRDINAAKNIQKSLEVTN